MPERTWAGPGCGAPCVICDSRVSADELEYELEFETGADGTRTEDYHVHRACFVAWEAEREKLDDPKGGTVKPS